MFKNIKIAISLVAAMAVFTPSTVNAQDLWKYFKEHGSFVGGVVDVDGQKERLVEVRINHDFPVAEKIRGDLRVGAFSFNRAGELANSSKEAPLPPTVEEVKSYSDGEVWLSFYRPVSKNIAVEAMGGVTFKMISVTGSVGDPLDGTKMALGLGLRFSSDKFSVSVIPGHFGPVVEGGKVAGLVPSVLIHGSIPLDFIGKKTTFVPDWAFGRLPNGDLARTLRLGIATKF